MSYTLWLLPHENQVKDYLSAIVTDLADKYHGPVFEPHATLLGDQQLSLEDITKKCTQLAQQTKSFTAQTGSVEYSTTYYQCVFVRLKPSPQLMELYDSAKKILGLTNPSVFMPHISLFYGNIPYDKRQEIIDWLKLKPLTFTVNSITITPGGENPPSEWKHLAEIPFK
jgi:2'-5' RNA ligase